MSAFEIIALLAMIAIALLASLVIAGPYYFDRPFWSDEVLSWLIATDPNFDHAMAALAGGVDTNAPLLHLLFRGLSQAVGTSPLVFRAAAMTAMVFAVIGLYRTIRRSTTPAAAAVGCLSFAALPMIIAHATEARFYAFELVAAIWTNLWLLKRGDHLVHEVRAGPSSVRNPRRGRPGSYAVRIALASVALCSIHYFGVIALASIVVAQLAADRSTVRRRLDRVWPTIAGFAVTACLLPLVSAQRTAMRDAGGTWVPDTFLNNLRVTLDMLLPAPAVLIAVVLMLAALRRTGATAILKSLRVQQHWLIAAVVYIGAMFAFDRVVQPVFVPRYFIVVLPAAAVVVAAIASHWHARATWLAMAALAICLVAQWAQIRSRSAAPDGRSAAALIACAKTIDPSQPIVSDWLGHALPIVQARPAERDRIRYFADMRLREEAFDSGIRYEREMAACVRRFYALPGETSLKHVRSLDHFVLMTEFPETIGERFPGYEARAVSSIAFEMTRGRERSVNAD